MSSTAKLVGTFVVVLGLVVGVAAVAPLLGGSTGLESRTASTLPVDSQPVSVPNETGTVRVDAETESKVVVIDRAHENSVTREDLQPLVASLVEAGHEVRFYRTGGEDASPGPSLGGGPGGGLNQSLRNADAFVTVAPQRPFKPDEIRGLTDFASRGGRVLMLAEPSRTKVSGGFPGPIVPGPVSPRTEQVSTELTGLAAEFGMSVGTGYLYNTHENANNFQHVYGQPATETELTAGVDRAVFQRATPITVDESTSQPVVTTTNRTRLSTTRDQSAYTLGARNENALLLGDTTFLTPPYYRDADNEVLLGNTIEFLVTGTKTPRPSTGQPGPAPNGSVGPPQAPNGSLGPPSGPVPTPPFDGGDGPTSPPTPVAP